MRLFRALATFLVALTFAVSAAAQLNLLGAGGPIDGSVVYDPGGITFSPQGSATYTAGGPNMNGGTDTRTGVVAFRRRATFGYVGGAGTSDQWRSSANFGTYGTGTCSAEGCKGFMVNQDAASWATPGNGWTLRNTYSNVDGAGTSTSSPSKTNWWYNNEWESVVIFYDTNAAANSRKFVYFQNGVQITSIATSDTGGAFDVFWNGAARGICINDCNRSTGFQFGGMVELADIIVDTTHALPAGCPATPANCQAVVDAYYNSGTSKPVNPGTGATDCVNFMAVLSAGNTPDWCLRGDKTNFLSNTGGDPAVHTMSVVNGVAASPLTGAIYNSSYGQGAEPTDRPFLAWMAPVSTSTVTTTSTTTCTSAFTSGVCESGVMGNFGNKILTGDMIFVAWLNCYTSASPSSTLPTISAGWTLVPSSTATNPTNDTGSSRCAWLVAYHVATNDYVPRNMPWQTGNAYVDPPTITYDCIPHGACATAPLRVLFIMFDYRSTNAVVSVDASDFLTINRSGGASSNFTTPSITTTVAKTTLVSLCGSKTNLLPMAPPTGTEMRYQGFYTAGNIPMFNIADEVLTSAGATGTRTFTQAGSPSTNDRAYCGLIALKNS
jgi:hypothetical protein